MAFRKGAPSPYPGPPQVCYGKKQRTYGICHTHEERDGVVPSSGSERGGMVEPRGASGRVAGDRGRGPAVQSPMGSIAADRKGFGGVTPDLSAPCPFGQRALHRVERDCGDGAGRASPSFRCARDGGARSPHAPWRGTAGAPPVRPDVDRAAIGRCRVFGLQQLSAGERLARTVSPAAGDPGPPFATPVLAAAFPDALGLASVPERTARDAGGTPDRRAGGRCPAPPACPPRPLGGRGRAAIPDRPPGRAAPARRCGAPGSDEPQLHQRAVSTGDRHAHSRMDSRTEDGKIHAALPTDGTPDQDGGRQIWLQRSTLLLQGFPS